MISNFDEITAPSFSFGTVVITAEAAKVISNTEITKALTRHASGDWGDVCKEDWLANDLVLEKQGRLISVYKSEEEVVFWIITEWNRSVTTILLPDD